MAFVRLDDGWLENPKLAQAGSLAAHLYAAGITYANRHLTDGYIPSGILNRLVDYDGVKWNGKAVTNRLLAERLVAEGLWIERADGWTIHDYLEFQPTREYVEAKRASVSVIRRAAGSKGGSTSQANRKQTVKQTASKPEAKNKPQTQTQTQSQERLINSSSSTSSSPSTAAARRAERTAARLRLSAVPEELNRAPEAIR